MNLLHKTTWRLFDELLKDPFQFRNPNINTNMGYTHRHMERLVEYINKLRDGNCIKAFKMFSSMDTWGARAEYMRTGLDLDIWEKNQDIYLQGVKSHLTHMVTFNILSVTSFTEYLAKMLEWRQKYEDVIINNLGSDEFVRKIRFDTSYLKESTVRHAYFNQKKIYLHYFDKSLKFIKDNVVEEDRTKFSNLNTKDLDVKRLLCY